MQLFIDAISTAHTFTGLMPASHYTVQLNATYSISDFVPTINMQIAMPLSVSTFAIPGN
jgi:hypothetical protein